MAQQTEKDARPVSDDKEKAAALTEGEAKKIVGGSPMMLPWMYIQSLIRGSNHNQS